MSTDMHWLLFYCCDKTPWPRQLAEEKVSLGMVAGTAENSYLKLQAGDREHTGNGRKLLEREPPLPPTYLLQHGHTSDSFPNSSTNWEPNIQIYESTGAILIQTRYVPS